MPPTGPTTPEGKAISARNSTRHGLRARAIVLPGESQDDWDAFEHAYIEDLAPVGISEEMLARRAAELLWRLRRVAAAERDAMDECANDPGAFKSTASYRKSFGYKTPNVFPDRLPESLPAVSALNPLMRYEAHLSRQYQAAMRDLLALQNRRRGNARITRVEIHGYPGNTTKPLAAVTIPAQPVHGSQPPPAVTAREDAKLPNELHNDGPHQTVAQPPPAVGPEPTPVLHGSQPPPAVAARENAKLPNELHNDGPHQNVAQPPPAVSPAEGTERRTGLEPSESHQYPRSFSSAADLQARPHPEEDQPCPAETPLSRSGRGAEGEGSHQYPRSFSSSESPHEDEAPAAEQPSSVDECTAESAIPQPDDEKLPTEVPTEVPTELPASAPTNELPGHILVNTINRLNAYKRAAEQDPSIKNDPEADSPRDIVVDAFARLKKHMPPGWRPPRELARFIDADRLMPSIEDVFREDEEVVDDPLRAATLPASLDGG